MKIDSLKFGAVIPTQQYGNLQPEIVISDTNLKKGTETGLKFISELFAMYSEKGGLTPKELAKQVTVGLKKKSFNESGVEVVFDPAPHTYFYGNKQLQGVTDYIKRFYKPFDAETISGILENKWNIQQETIKEIWEESGELTSDFGTLVHKTLEFYHNRRNAGEVIAMAKGEAENYCLPKHPILRAIVKGFLSVDKTKGKIISEALITDVGSGICGHADRIEIIDEAKKICRIGDYKVNIDSDIIDKSHKVLSPFETLPSNKLSKYQLQMSTYANMLEKSGWTVEGLDVYVYESEWRHFPLSVLKVI